MGESDAANEVVDIREVEQSAANFASEKCLEQSQGQSRPGEVIEGIVSTPDSITIRGKTEEENRGGIRKEADAHGESEGERDTLPGNAENRSHVECTVRANASGAQDRPEALQPEVASENFEVDTPALENVETTSELQSDVIDISPLGSDLSVALSSSAEKNVLSVPSSDVKELYLYDNALSILPQSVDSFVNLRVLKVFSNDVRFLPCEVASLVHLETLYLKTDPTSLAKLPDLDNLTSLKSLELQQVPLRPQLLTLPPSIGKLKNLTRLALCHYSISSVPPEIGELSSLVDLDLSGNCLESLPPQLGQLGHLTSLTVASNRLTSLPGELGNLSELQALNVSNNLLTSLDGLKLEGLTRLKSLNAEYNRLGALRSLPEWMSCRLEGNERGMGEQTGVESEEESADCSGTSSPPAPPLKGIRVVPSELQRRERQERLARSRGGGRRGEAEGLMSEGGAGRQGVVRGEKEEKEVVVSMEGAEKGATEDTPAGNQAGDGMSSELDTCINAEEVEKGGTHGRSKEGVGEDVGGKVGPTLGRRLGHDQGLARNPKPSKRRRAVDAPSASAYKYHRESFCGVGDRVEDGFYDAGRNEAFLPLEELEKAEVNLMAREVILVDRRKDEELDAMLTSARRLLSGPAGSPTTALQKAVLLALFVSDCFGGTDRSRTTAHARQAALGGGQALACGCGEGGGKASVNGVPTVEQLCEQSLVALKSAGGSNVVAIGAIPFGICRHRAILLKYLCDHADPPVPCDLVRGLLDARPHAWNVVKVGGRCLLVDACRPKDVLPEADPGVAHRYLPLCRIELPEGEGAVDTLSPVLHEEIGRGASGAVVRRCTFGGFTAAAKIHGCDWSDGRREGERSVSLHELRMLCALPAHPSLVSFYGHHIRSALQGRGEGEGEGGVTLYLEYMGGGSLEDGLKHVRESGNPKMSDAALVSIARDVAKGVECLHAQGIIHRDIKSANVLLSSGPATWREGSPTLVAKICDFSTAVRASLTSARACHMAACGAMPADVCVGTPRWMAPEVLQAMHGRRRYGVEADIWSFGCLLVEMLSLNAPFHGMQDSQVCSSIQMGQRPRLDQESCGGKGLEGSRVRRRVGQIMGACTKRNCRDRPTASELVIQLEELLADLEGGENLIESCCAKEEELDLEGE